MVKIAWALYVSTSASAHTRTQTHIVLAEGEQLDMINNAIAFFFSFLLICSKSSFGTGLDLLDGITKTQTEKYLQVQSFL